LFLLGYGSTVAGKCSAIEELWAICKRAKENIEISAGVHDCGFKHFQRKVGQGQACFRLGLVSI
jgi:hypothetical protein